MLWISKCIILWASQNHTDSQCFCLAYVCCCWCWIWIWDKMNLFVLYTLDILDAYSHKWTWTKQRLVHDSRNNSISMSVCVRVFAVCTHTHADTNEKRMKNLFFGLLLLWSRHHIIVAVSYRLVKFAEKKKGLTVFRRIDRRL